MAENASEGREDQHVCGASGFGFASDDETFLKKILPTS